MLSVVRTEDSPLSKVKILAIRAGRKDNHGHAKGLDET